MKPEQAGTGLAHTGERQDPQQHTLSHVCASETSRSLALGDKVTSEF